MRLVLDIGKKYPEITGPMSDAFANELNQACANDDFSELVLDFDGTRIISSMAMGTIFAVYQKLKEKGKSMQIIHASDKVVHLLRMVNMAEILM
ncbi:MAG: STAS domain-containing protein [Planctomycetes bacterium]|nr:STAS domain-containing protein [Planctomycetota bacterium]